jgi:hypothetical protein
MSTLSIDFIRQIARAVERGRGTMADVDRLVALWREHINGDGAGLRGVLRTFEGEPLPRVTEDAIVAIRPALGEREVIASHELATALGTDAKKLAKLLGPAGICPLSLKLADGQRKAYRRGWFEGYFEQLDRAYAAPAVQADEALIEKLKDTFDAVEVAAGTVQEPIVTEARAALLRWWAERPGRQPDHGAALSARPTSVRARTPDGDEHDPFA